LGGFDLKEQAERFVFWLEDGYLSARDRAFDVGMQTTESLSKVNKILRNGTVDQLESLSSDSDEQSNGDGSLMRILPLVVYIKGMPLPQQFEIIHKASALIYPHICSALCYFYYLKMAEYIIEGVDKFKALLTLLALS